MEIPRYKISFKNRTEIISVNILILILKLLFIYNKIKIGYVKK